jgi:hypothetical protein
MVEWMPCAGGEGAGAYASDEDVGQLVGVCSSLRACKTVQFRRMYPPPSLFKQN